MKNRGREIGICLITAGLLAACSESITNPDTPGSGLLIRDVVIRDTVVTAISDTTFLHRIAADPFLLSPLTRDLVGKDGSYKAYAAIRFSVVSPRDTITVLSATMILRLITWQGDTTGLFSFNVHSINTGWREDTLRWNQVNSPGFFDPALIKGEYSGRLSADTEYIRVTLDTAMVREWFRTNTTANNGILLVPKPNCTMIRGIGAFDVDADTVQPSLQVIARGPNAAKNDTIMIRIGSDSYVADADPFPLNPERILTQAGIAYRSKLLFDVSQIPRGSIISSAQLLLEGIPGANRISKFTTTPQPIVNALLSADSTNFESTFAAGSIAGTGNSFAFDVRRQVQLWVNGHNYGLILRQPTTNELSTLDLFTFYSNNAPNPDLRPRIKLKYTVFKN